MRVPCPGDLIAPNYGAKFVSSVWLHRDVPLPGTAWDPRADVLIDVECDGLLFIIARVNDWCFVMTSKTLLLGWIDHLDLALERFGFSV